MKPLLHKKIKQVGPRVGERRNSPYKNISYIFLNTLFLIYYHSILYSYTLMYDIVYYSIILIITYIVIILTGWTVSVGKLSQTNNI